MHEPTSSAVQRFFAGITEQTFHVRLGVADPQLVDYVSDLLVRFLRADTLYRLRSLTGKPLTEVVSMLGEAEQRVGDAKREAHRHIGDFTLFWVGVYPDALQKLRRSDRRDALIDYREQGKRAYAIAGRIAVSDTEEAPAEVLQSLSDQYDLCAYGLGEVRRAFEEGDPADGPILLN
jgi:hypothetical protein